MCAMLRLVVQTPAATLLEVTGVRRVQVQLVDGGGIGIYPGHAPLIAETVTAPLRYEDESGEHNVRLYAGILQVAPGLVTIQTTGYADSSTADALRRPVATGQPPDEERLERLASVVLRSTRADHLASEETSGATLDDVAGA